MRRLSVPILSLAVTLCFTAPSHGWWLFHRAHSHRGGYAAQPVAAPLTVGVQLPGGIGLNLTPDGSILQHLQQAMQNRQGQQPAAPGKVTVSSDVAATIDRIGTKSAMAADKLNALILSINKSDVGAKLDPVGPAEPKVPAKTSADSGVTPIGGGLAEVIPAPK